MDTPVYLRYLSSIFTFLYLYIFTPLSIIVESWILVAYSINMVWDSTITPERKFRRGVAVFFPFLLSLYAVLASEIYVQQIKLAIPMPFYLVLLAGLVIGFAFMAWISRVDDSDELFATLSCFVSSLIFFAVLTVFIVTRSFEIISFVFGFLFGVSIYVIRYGFSNVDRFRIKVPKRWRQRIYHFVRRKKKAASSSKTQIEDEIENAS